MGAGGSTTSKGAEKTSSGMVSGASKGAVGGYSGGVSTGGAVGGKSSGPGGAGGVRNTSTGTRPSATASAAAGGKQAGGGGLGSSPGGKQASGRESANAATGPGGYSGGGGLGGDRGGKQASGRESANAATGSGGYGGGSIGGGGYRGGDPGVANVPGGVTGRGVGPSAGPAGGLGRIGGAAVDPGVAPVPGGVLGRAPPRGVGPAPGRGPGDRAGRLADAPQPLGGTPGGGIPVGGGINIGPFGRATDPTEGAMTAMADMGMPMAPGYTPGAYSPSPGVPGSMPSASRFDNPANFNVVAGMGAPDTFSGPNTYGGLTMGLPDDSYAGLTGENQPRAPKDQDSLAEVNAPHPVARDPTYDATTGPYGAYNPAGLGAPGMGAYRMSPRQGVPQAPMASLTDFNAPAPSDEPDMAEMQREFDRARALTNQSRQRGWAEAAAGAPDLSRQAFEDRGVPTPGTDPARERAFEGERAYALSPTTAARSKFDSLPGEYDGLPPGYTNPSRSFANIPQRAPEPGYSNPPRSFANIPQRAPPVAGPGYTNPARSFANIPQRQPTTALADAPDILSPTQLSSGYTMRGLTPQPGVPSQPPTDVADVPQPGPPMVLGPQPEPIDDVNQAPAPGGYMDAARANKWAGEPRAYPRGVPDTDAERIAAKAIAGGIGLITPGTEGFIRGTSYLTDRANAGKLGNRPGQPYATGSSHADAKAVGGKQEGRYGSPGTKKSKAERDRERLAKAIDEWSWIITDKPLPTSATF